MVETEGLLLMPPPPSHALMADDRGISHSSVYRLDFESNCASHS